MDARTRKQLDDLSDALVEVTTAFNDLQSHLEEAKEPPPEFSCDDFYQLLRNVAAIAGSVEPTDVVPSHLVTMALELNRAVTDWRYS